MLENTQDAQLPPNANDGTIDGAVAALQGVDLDNLVSFDEAANRDAGLPPPDVMAQHKERQQPRDPATQQFRSPNEVPPNHNQKPAEANAAAEAAQGEASDPAEEFFELPPEEDGGEPRRIAATEVFEGYQRAQQLQAELEQARRVAPPPVEWDQQMYQTVQARHQLVQALETMTQTMLPPEPNIALIDPNSPAYDPGAYHHQQMIFQDAQRRLAEVNRARQMQMSQLQQEQNALREAARIREQGRLREIWPEIVQPAVQRQVIDDAARHYGITKADFDNTLDSRLYHILKDALAYRAGQSQRQAAVKVVRSAPKLVRTQARETQGRGQATYSNAMRRLQQTGSIEDAANAIGGLLS